MCMHGSGKGNKKENRGQRGDVLSSADTPTAHNNLPPMMTKINWGAISNYLWQQEIKQSGNGEVDRWRGYHDVDDLIG